MNMDQDEKIIGNGLSSEEVDLVQHFGTHLATGTWKRPHTNPNVPFQKHVDFRKTYDKLRKEFNGDQTAIAKHLQMTTTELRARIAENKAEMTRHLKERAQNLKRNGKSNVAISEIIFGDRKHDTTVGNWLKDRNTKTQEKFDNTKKALLEELEKSKYIDVGEGTDLYLGVSATTLAHALKSLEKDGYKVYSHVQVEQYGLAQQGINTSVKVLTKPDVSEKEVYDHLDEVRPAFIYSEDNGKTFRKIEPPTSIDGKRIYIRYAEEGGITKDGTIEIRPGVEDLSLGGAHYAQVRIGVNGTHYLKGMALYSDNVPEGYDVVFNTNKHQGTPMINTDDPIDGKQVLKPMKANPEDGKSPSEVFGTSIKDEDRLILAKQRHYTDKNGEEKLSAINIVNEEGAWNEWANTIASQVLGKQPHALAKQQLDLTYQMKREQLNDILALTNPTIKKDLLERFADQCESDAVDLKAYGMPRQTTKVILPVDALKDNEIYCPDLPDGTQVVLIRYPHASIHEIPSLIVNNQNPSARKILGNDPIDGVGINVKVAQHLSGADFDGDTVLVIPNNDGRMQFAKQYDELKNIDLEALYPYREGMKILTDDNKGAKMGEATNLIFDMTIAKATDPEMVRALRYSMCVIDAVKHKLDYKRAYNENGILALKRKYQMREDGHMGASSLLTQNKSPLWLRRKKGYYVTDPDTGKKVWKVTGEETELYKTTKLAVAEDARELISKYNSPIERVYAQFSNNMKAMALEARKAAIATPNLVFDKEASVIYAAEVASLNDKLRTARLNRPLERLAQRLANVAVKQFLFDNPGFANKPDDVKKLKGRTLQEKRALVGAKKKQVDFTENEWKAIQAGAVHNSLLKELLKNADSTRVKQLAMPRERTVLSSSMKTQIQNLLKKYTIDQVADMRNIPVSQVKAVSAEMRKS